MIWFSSVLWYSALENLLPDLSVPFHYLLRLALLGSEFTEYHSTKYSKCLGFQPSFSLPKKRKMVPYLLINLVAAIATTFLNKLSQKTGWKFNAGVLQGNSWIHFLKHKLCKQLSLPPVAGYEGIHSSGTLWVGVHISATTGELCVHHSLDINCIRQGSWSLYNPVVWIFPPPASYKPVVHFVVFFFSGRLDKEIWLLERRLMFTANNLPVSAAEWHLLIMWL